MAFLGKAYLWLVGTAMLFLVGYATVPSDANPSIANILWYIFVALGAMSLLTGGGYFYLLGAWVTSIKSSRRREVLEDVEAPTLGGEG